MCCSAVAVDTGYAIYMRYFSPVEARVAYVAHFAGFLGGELLLDPHRHLIVSDLSSFTVYSFSCVQRSSRSLKVLEVSTFVFQSYKVLENVPGFEIPGNLCVEYLKVVTSVVCGRDLCRLSDVVIICQRCTF